MVEKNEEETKRANALTPKKEDNPAVVDENVEGGSTPNVAVPLDMGDNTGKTPEEVKAEREDEEKKDGESVE